MDSLPTIAIFKVPRLPSTTHGKFYGISAFWAQLLITCPTGSSTAVCAHVWGTHGMWTACCDFIAWHGTAGMTSCAWECSIIYVEKPPLPAYKWAVKERKLKAPLISFKWPSAQWISSDQKYTRSCLSWYHSQDCTARTIKIFNLATILTESRHSTSLDESTAQASYLIFGSVNILNWSPETELQPRLAFCFLTP